MKNYSQTEIVASRDRNEAWLMAQEGGTGTAVGLANGGEVMLRIFAVDQTRRAIVNKLAGAPLTREDGELVAD